MFAHRVFTRPTELQVIREEALKLSTADFAYDHPTNGEEQEYRNAAGLNYVANYSKALPHNSLGEVAPSAFRAMVRALVGRDPQLFEQVPVGSVSGLNLTNPQSGLAFDLEGYDAPRLGHPTRS